MSFNRPQLKVHGLLKTHKSRLPVLCAHSVYHQLTNALLESAEEGE